jgi:G2/mitotic-specific cyclin 3/4
MLGGNGIRAAAKRTAFGDVSNVSKNLNVVVDESAGINKAQIEDRPQKISVAQDKPATFLRPAQRPLAGLKGLLGSNNATSTSAKSQDNDNQAAAAKPKTLTRRATTAIYRDPGMVEQPSQSATTQSNAPVAPVYQHLGPRQFKSQPQLKTAEPAPRHVQSKYVEVLHEEHQEVDFAPASVYEDAVEQHLTSSEDHLQDPLSEDIRQDEEVALQVQDDMYRDERQLPSIPLVSEPEEYWPEEDEEEIYDEQGYSTAHSYRSRGENTTGGATTVLFPKITSKTKKELAMAKEIVEGAKTFEEIEDEAWDTSMVAEYGDEIFGYMRELEVSFTSLWPISSANFRVAALRRAFLSFEWDTNIVLGENVAQCPLHGQPS